MFSNNESDTYKHSRYRKPPVGILENQLAKCILPQPCVFKDACQNAHSDGELQAWKEQLRLENKSDGYVHPAAISIKDHRSLINEKLRELQEGQNESDVISELIGSHSVIADENLFIMHVGKDKELAWVFTVSCLKTVSSTQVLERVFLMNESAEFFISYIFYPTSDNIRIKPVRLPDKCQMWENAHQNKNFPVIKILLRFQSNKYGLFQQDVVFDFGGFPKLVRKLGVQVASEEYLSQTMKHDPQIHSNNELTWMEKHEIIEIDGHKSHGFGSILYPLPPNIENLVVHGAFKHLDLKVVKENYRQRLHTLLFIEEYQRRADLQSVSLHLNDFRCCLDTIEFNDFSNETATVVLDEYVMEELAKLVGRSGQALVRVNTYEKGDVIITEPIVFRVVVQAMNSESFVLQISNMFLSLLQTSRIDVDVDICFCLVDIFQVLHNAVEKVSLDLVFPDLSMQTCLPLPSQNVFDEKLSGNQVKAMSIVLNPIQTPPILLLGPFGAGKTRTIATIISKLMSDTGIREKHILLCTQSNSAADHYIQEYFHPLHMPGAGELVDSWKTPLRINWQHRYVESVSDRVLSYCLIDKSTGKFATATKEDLDKHVLIISTVMTSSDLHKLHLPTDYFSHIFIDEAAQTMEAEGLVPLLLAEKKTKIILAGDHMQMCTPLSSNVAKDLDLGKSLLERLFEYYPFDVDCKLKLLENFRSYKEIVDLSSHLFYDNSLLCNNLKVDPEQYPVQFYGVDGLEIVAKSNPSYKNDIEASEVLIRLAEIQLFWEKRNVTPDLSKFCVISFYPAQVRRIRKILRENDMASIRVESVNNVQGLEFDVLIISTVRTLCDATFSDEYHGRDMGFLTNPKLLNTALTRARYQVVIIGNPLALCTIGECKPCWKTILSVCDENNSFYYKMGYDTFVQALHNARNDSTIQSKPVRPKSGYLTTGQTNPIGDDITSALMPDSIQTPSNSISKSQTDPTATSLQSVPPIQPPSYQEAITITTRISDSSVASCQQTKPSLLTCRFTPTISPPQAACPQCPTMVPPAYTNTSNYLNRIVPSNNYVYRSMLPFCQSLPMQGFLYANAGYASYPNTGYASYPNIGYASYPTTGYASYPNIGYARYPNTGYASYPYAHIPPPLSKVLLPPCKNLLDLRQKITFVHNYCLHLLDKVNSNSITNDLLQKNGSDSLQKLEELSRTFELCEPSVLEASVIDIEREIEKCYLFGEDRFNSFVKAHPEIFGGIFPGKIMTKYEKLQKQVYDIELFLKDEQFKYITLKSGDKKVGTQLKKDIYALSFHLVLISYEMQVCQCLLMGALITELFNAKLDFIEKSIQEAETAKEKLRENLVIHNTPCHTSQATRHLVDSINVSSVQKVEEQLEKLERNMEAFKINEQDPDVWEWFMKRRDDPYVQEYVTTNNRSLAERLPSPLTLSSESEDVKQQESNPS